MCYYYCSNQLKRSHSSFRTHTPTIAHQMSRLPTESASHDGGSASAAHDQNPNEPSSALSIDDQPLTAQDSSSSEVAVRSSLKRKVLSWPWVTFLIFLYIFILFWINYAIVQRYWIQHNWNDALPGLDKTDLRKFTMRSHMTAGAISLLLGPIQFVPAFRRRASLRGIHRWSGRLYCTCGMLSSLFGLWFIALKQQLVGGYNMTASFALAGMATGLTSFKAWQTGRRARLSDTNQKALFVDHRNWGIRSFAQILAPALYRYWYTMMELFHIYNVPVPLRMGGYCDANDQCPDYSRPWDAVYTWLYWISAGIVAELIISFLPGQDTSMDGEEGDTITAEEAALASPFLSQSLGENAASSEGESSTTYGSAQPRESFADDVGLSNLDRSRGKPWVVNLVGSFLAAAAVVITCTTFYTVLVASSPP